MTRTLSLRTSDLADLHPTFQQFKQQFQKNGVGFENMLDEVMRMNSNQSTGYPPYNIIKQTDDKYYIEIAVAGFSENELRLELNNQVLAVHGNKAESQDIELEYLHRGISGRTFERVFTLAEHVQVVDALNKDGILSIFLERIVPEEKRPKTIDIKFIK